MRFLLGVLLGLAGVEVGLRLLRSETDLSQHYFSRGSVVPDPDSLMRLRPDVDGHTKRFGSAAVPLVTDGAGCRVPASGPPPRARRTILVFGASQGFGLTIPAEATFPARLEAILDERHGPEAFRVANASLPGDKVPDYPGRLRRLRKEVEPDLLVFAIYLHRGFENQLVRTDRRVEDSDGFLLDAGRAGRGTALDVLRTRSFLAMGIFARLRDIGAVDAPAWFRPLTLRHAVDAVEESLRRLVAEASEGPVRLAAVLLPEYDFLAPPLADLHALARERLSAWRIPALDLGLHGPEGRRVRPGDVSRSDRHLTAAGSETVALILADFLRSSGLLEFP